jgi:hypothetical protein
VNRFGTMARKRVTRQIADADPVLGLGESRGGEDGQPEENSLSRTAHRQDAQTPALSGGRGA